MTQPMTLEDVARRAVDGDRDALDVLVRDLQGDVYGLVLRMLWNREDAEDATQEILVRVVTRLSQFDFRSRLKTWVYRVAVNYILDVKKSPVERLHLTFDTFADDLAEGLSTDGPMDAERSLLVEEVKIGCTLGMLQCLDRPHRLAYVLGEILGMSGPEAADALEINPDVFRKRLQHARAAILSFTRAYCGLASDKTACACNDAARDVDQRLLRQNLLDMGTQWKPTSEPLTRSRDAAVRRATSDGPPAASISSSDRTRSSARSRRSTRATTRRTSSCATSSPLGKR
jgi:RNA polymerase sigma factor (sigma-70 family)